MPVNRIAVVNSAGGLTSGGQAQYTTQAPIMEIIMPQSASTNVPAFLAKLWKMVDNPETDLLISWTEGGNSFMIKNQAQFSRDLLPYYYKHSNMASFIRQLNMYGFHKVVGVDSGGLKGDRDEIEFAHPYFLRGQEHLLPEIKRKVSSVVAKNTTSTLVDTLPNIKSDKVVIDTDRPRVTELMTEVGMLKDRQEDTDTKLDTMRKENEALWQEVLNLRQKHSQQQKIVNKLIHFLMAVVQPRMTTGLKRRYVPHSHLAIDSPSYKAKEAKLDSGKAGPVIQDVTHTLEELENPLMSLLEEGDDMTSPMNFMPSVSSPKIEMPQTPRPVDTYIDSPPPTMVQTSNVVPPADVVKDKYRLVNPAAVNSAIVQSPVNTMTSTSTSNTADKTPRPALNREISKEDFDLDINNMQAELDNLKDILSGQITLDSSLVSSLFNPEENHPNMNGFNYNNLPNNITINADGFEDLQQDDLKSLSFQPNLFELTSEDEEPDSILGNMLPPPPVNQIRTPISDIDLNTPLATPLSRSPPDSTLNTPMIQEDDINPLSRL